VPGAWGPFEVAVQTVVAAGIGDAATREALARLVGEHGTPVAGLGHGLTHAFPSPEVLVGLDAGDHGLPAPIVETVAALAWAVRSGTVNLDGGEATSDLVGTLTAIPGIGLAAARNIALRLGAHAVETGGGVATAAPMAEVRR
jgi:AraC family transcriptional regulator of adaptative response / DNA-3-methyladenine glycosylase II